MIYTKKNVELVGGDMPGAAIAAVEPDHILPLKEIGPFLTDLNLEEE